MLPKDTFNDRETQVLKVALKHLQEHLMLHTDPPVKYRPLNEYDILAPRHSLVHVLTAMKKIEKINDPATHFQNPQQPVATLQQPNEH